MDGGVESCWPKNEVVPVYTKYFILCLDLEGAGTTSFIDVDFIPAPYAGVF